MVPIRIKLPKRLHSVPPGVYTVTNEESIEIAEPLEVRDTPFSPEEQPVEFTVKCPNCGEYHKTGNQHEFPCPACWAVDRGIRRWIAFPLAQQVVLKLLRERGIVE